MIKIKIPLILIFLFALKSFSSPSLPFLFGLEAGPAINFLNTSAGYREQTFYIPRAGLLLGVPVLVPFNNRIALSSGLRYIQKNYTYERSFGQYVEHTNGFLQLPLLADFSVGQNRWRAFLDFGAAFDIWIHSKRNGMLIGPSMMLYPFNERVEFNSQIDRRFQASLLTGIGIRYVLSDITVFLSVQYGHALTDLQKSYMARGQISRYNNTLIINTGFLFGRMR